MQHYQQLFLTSTQNKSIRPGRCLVIGFTSANYDEGVSYVTQSFGIELARKTNKTTLIADARRLLQVNICHYSNVSKYCYKTEVPNLWVLPPMEESALSVGNNSIGGMGDVERGLNNLQTLRFAFSHILIDFPALNDSNEATIFAQEIEGIVMVVEADKTRRERIKSAQQTIERAKGKMLGYVLNKRKYLVPNWLYQKL
jgi:Mrp family chromosome partitioning ATPase